MSAPKLITRADIEGTPCTYEAHYNYGSKGGGYGYRSDRFPRFSFIDRVYKGIERKKRGIGERFYYVDGKECASFEEAIDRLNTEVELTDEERAALEHVPDDYGELRAIEAKVGGYDPAEREPGGFIEPGTPRSRALGLMYALKVKGQIEYLPRPPRKQGAIPFIDDEPFTPMVRRFRADREEADRG